MITYLVLSGIFLCSTFVKGLKHYYIWLTALSIFICFLSLRSEPDEYFRYMQNSVSSLDALLSLSILSEPLYQGLCLALKYLFSPFVSLKILYIISYSLPFYSLYLLSRSLSLHTSCKILSLNLATFCYISHSFLVLSYIGIRSSFALGFLLLSLWAISNLMPRLSFFFLFCTVASHLQFLPVCIIIAIISCKSSLSLHLNFVPTLKMPQKYQNLILLFLFLLLIVFSYTFLLPLVSSSLSSLLQSLDLHYSNYLYSDSYGYALSLTDPQYLLNLFTPIAIYCILFYRNNSFASIPRFSFIPLIGVIVSIIFSSSALFAYRISFTFYAILPFLIIQYFSSMGYCRRYLIIILSSILLTYNLFIAERLIDLSF